jgi:exosortase
MTDPCPNFEWKPVLREIARWMPLGLVFAFAYYTTLSMLWYEWSHAPDYSHCFMVPVFSAWVLWERRGMLAGEPLRGSWWGLVFFALTGVLLAGGAYMYLVYFERISLLPCAAGVALFVGGPRALKWAWPAIAYLIFMIPLPGPLLVLLSYPLQRLGTLIATFILQLVGIPASAQANVVVLREARVDVVAACSGLRILMLCIAICVATVMITRRNWIQKLLIVASAIPIALVANIARITITALIYELIGHALKEELVHDVAGYLMMPGAVALLWAELELMSRALRRRERRVHWEMRGFA